MGAWIETDLYSDVLSDYFVAPYVGAWIETLIRIIRSIRIKSHPTWVRGLKQEDKPYHHIVKRVAPYVGAWIETFDDYFIFTSLEVAPYVGAWIETRAKPV